MFSYAMRKQRGLYVGLYSGSTVEDSDYQRCITSMTEIELATRGNPRGLLAILVTDPGTPSVPPVWRKKMAEFNAQVEASPYLMSIVTSSMITRGVLAAINWRSPKPPGHERVAHVTFAQARAWAEARRAEPLGVLDDLLAEARRRS